jgi:hypothetical protein
MTAFAAHAAPAALPAAQDTSQLAIARANAGTAPPLSPAVLRVVLLSTLGLAALVSTRLLRQRTYR